MKQVITNIYEKSPHFVKHLIASARGAQLNWWRLHNREAHLSELAEMKSWNDSKWHSYRSDKLRKMLETAALHVPYYHNYWKQHGGLASKAYLDLNNWPILKKDDLRRDPTQFLSQRIRVKNCFKIQTSGTTGKPVSLFFSREALSNWYSICEWHLKIENGVSNTDTWCNFGGQIIVPVAKTKPPFWIYNRSMHQLYLSSYHIAKENIDVYIKALDKYKVKYIWGYSSSIYNLAYLGLLGGHKAPQSVRLILTNAEPLFDYQREAIGKFFNCPIVQTYSSSEQVFGASECPNGTMHVWPEAGIIEVADANDQISPTNHYGRLIATGLINEAMPLIRYEVGDMVKMAGKTACTCGSKAPIIEEITGRFDDVLVTKEGRFIGRLDPVFKTDINIMEAQIIQKTIDDILIKIVPGNGFGQSDKEKITARIKERMGDVNVIYETTDKIPLGANGKFKAVISEVKR